MTTIALWILGIIFFIIIAVIFVLGYARYVELKAAEKKANQVHHDARDMQQQYRLALQNISNQKLISTPQKQGISKLINNFFVFQPINDINFSRFNQLYETMILAFTSIDDPAIHNKERIAVALEELASNLPVSNSDYNARFYIDVAPILAKELLIKIEALKQVVLAEEAALREEVALNEPDMIAEENEQAFDDAEKNTQSHENAG